ncbi:MAG: FAD-dependent oxidoreductase [Defluviitaleaceae bacterium]|nr:FAD-dependent oxidoreductase [Defluviitaleaceae bacterium]
MNNKYPNISNTIKVGSHTYKNRIIAAPIYCGNFAEIPFLSTVLRNSVIDKARGGVAQVTVGETPVDYDHANREPFHAIDYTQHEGIVFDFLKEMTGIIHENAAVAMIEISHCGESKIAIPGLKNPIGPMGFTREDGAVVVAMDEAMMQEVCQNFVTCAQYMKAAGFDGVVIHAGHGWLLHQFLSARTNQRADGYGGSLDARAKFPIQVIKAVRDAMGPDFVIEIRVSGDEKMEGGMGVEETAAFCKMIEHLADMIHVSVGIYRDPILSGEFSSLFHPYAVNAEASRAIKEAVSIPVAVVGGIISPDIAEELIRGGSCDIAAIARPLTADPDFVNKALTGNEDDIAKCLRCFKCFPGPLEGVIDDLSKLFGCTVNPKAFYFDEAVLGSKPESSKKVLVVGGGVAGMEAAIVAADRGHSVTLYEKSDKLGGLLKFADNDSFKAELADYKNLLIRRVGKRDITVLTNTACTPEAIAASDADVLVLALGSQPVVPPISGIENAISACDVYNQMDKVGKKVVMIGGGLVGCEVGLHLAKVGHDVTVIEMLDKVASDAYPMYRVALINEMDKRLTHKAGLKCTKIEANGIYVSNKDGAEEFLAADTVVYALGMDANSEETAKLRDAADGKQIFEIGDCASVGKVYDAARQGFVTGMSIL